MHSFLETIASRVNPAWRYPLLVSFVVAMLVVLDPLLSRIVPRSMWDAVALGDSPLRLILLFIPLAIALWLSVRALSGADNYRRAFLVMLAVASQVGGINLGPIDLLDIVTLLAVITLLGEIALKPETPLLIPALIMFGLFFLLLAIPYLAQMGVVVFFIGFIKLFKTILLAFVLINLIRDRDDILFFIKAVMIVAVISALIGIAQSAVYFIHGYAFTLMDDIDEAFKPTPIGYVLRASALCPTAQFLSGFLLVSLPLFLWRLVESAPGWPRRRLIAGLGIVLAGILLTWNYGAIFTAAGMLVLAPFIMWPNRTIHLIIGAAFLSVLLYYTGIFEWIYDKSLGDVGVFKGVSQRQSLLLKGMEVLSRDPWFGTGLDGFSYYTHNIFNRPVHNAGVQIWTELGFLGFIGFIAMNLILLTKTFILAFTGNTRINRLFRMLLLGLVGLIQLMFSEPFMNSQIVWLYLALVQICIIIEARQTIPDKC
jgi:hypothetical protein